KKNIIEQHLIFSAVTPSFAASSSDDVDDEDLRFIEDLKEDDAPGADSLTSSTGLDEFEGGEDEDPDMYNDDDDEEGACVVKTRGCNGLSYTLNYAGTTLFEFSFSGMFSIHPLFCCFSGFGWNQDSIFILRL
ncbi:unnamed protein product, partial [Arabidopsis halleri]